ncbi:hypothetical protein COV18_05855 [Candidatus Woesearchaeota archaeon CG10_big_fil_rev_8_21_14_0_10_37_12]|nr:MAG: hypothetical protein COV18_05855 [Candidatus Woesearchaeota archaeon CG10_big_fil_rev_8_21_14_0_10_37_12]
MKLIIVFLLLIATATAYTISDYPSFFVQDNKFKAVYVIGEEAESLDVVSATEISTALAKYPNLTITIGTSKLDSEITDIKTYNAIVIGSPCDNRAAYDLQGNPDPCYKNLGGSSGYIELYSNNGRTQLLITGLTAEDRYAAAKFLATKTLTSLNTKQYIISTNTGSRPPFFAQKPNNKTKTTQPVETPKTSNETVETAKTQKTQEQQIQQKRTIEPGPYEPIEKIPEQKSFFGKILRWITNLFT